MLPAPIHHSLQVFRHDHMKPVQAKAMQTILQGQDMFVSVLAGYGKC